MKSVSVIIPTFRRPKLLTRCLEALASSTFHDFEVIVVDDSGENNLAGLINGFRTHLRILYVNNIKTTGPGGARNVGARSAMGDLLAFLDDDIVPSEKWLAEGYAIFQKNPEIVAVIGKTTLPFEESRDPFKHYMIQEKAGGFPACNLWVRRDAFVEIGGFSEEFFDPKLKIFHHEDADLAFRLMNKGKVIFCPTLIVYHPAHSESMWRPINTAKKAYFDPLLAKRHPDKYALLTTWRIGRFNFRKARVRGRLSLCIFFLITAIGILLGQRFLAFVAFVIMSALVVSLIFYQVDWQSLKKLSWPKLVLLYPITLLASLVFAIYLVRGMIRFSKAVL